MKHLTIFIFGILLILLLGVGAGIAWLVGTSEGTRNVLRLVSRFTPLQIEARTIDGRILGELRLGGVHAKLPHMEAEIERLHLAWLPYGLFSGRLLVRELNLQGVRIQDNSPPSGKAPKIEWPQITGRATGLEARIERLQLDDVVYRRLDRAPLEISRVSAAAGWRNGVLSLDGLTVAAPKTGTIAGSILAGFIRPSLKAELKFIPARPAAQMDRLSLHARMLPGRRPEQMSGTIAVTGFSGAEERLTVTGDIGITPTKVNVHRMRLSQPGRRGALTGDGTVELTAKEPLFDVRVEVDSLDMSRETGLRTDISGHLSIAGSSSGYRGEFTFANRGESWRMARLSAAFAGDDAGISLSPFNGTLLNGTIQGNAAVQWKGGLSGQGAIRARNIDPSRVDPRLVGIINADIEGDATRTAAGQVRGRFRCAILESLFLGRPLTGEAVARMEGKKINISRLALHGKGYNIAAGGNLAQKLTFSANITDLAGIVPGAAGRMTADGWLHWRGGIPDGAVRIKGWDVAAAGARISSGSIAATLGPGKDPQIAVGAAFAGVEYQRFAADTFTLDLAGTATDHVFESSITSPGASIRIALQGGYREKRWQGLMTGLSGRDSEGGWQLQSPAPFTLARDRVVLSGFTLTGVGSERFSASGEIRRNPLRGSIRSDFRQLLLARANPWLKGVQLNGAASGSLDLKLLPEERFTASGELSAAGSVIAGKQRLELRRTLVRLDWQEHGLNGLATVDMADGGNITAKFNSPSPPRLAVPAAGDADIEWNGLDPALLRPWIPANLSLSGRLAGRVTAKLLPGQRLDMLGKATLTGGTVSMENPGGRLSTAIRSLDASWAWRENGVRGGFTLELAQWGQSRGEFLLPVPARLPVAIDKKSRLQAHLTGRVQELGVLTALFPGVVQETHGELAYDIRAGGTLAAPEVAGSVQLAKAGAFIPSAGIHVSDVQLHAGLSNESVTIDTFRAVSGPGYLQGTAEIRLKGNTLSDFKGKITGENFEAIRLPELHGFITPRLEFAGTAEKVAIKGELLIPELRVTGETPQAPVQPSRDVIITDAPVQEPVRRMAVALQLGIKLGEHVTVKAKGIDARLGGGLDLTGEDIAKLTSKGEIKVVKGRYKAYGLDLEITRGRIFYAGGPLSEPTLDILAIRTVGDVKAGVSVGGTVQAPVIKLYSEPQMPDVDIVAYMVLGHPLGQSGEQASLVSKAAGALLSAGQSVALQDQLKSRLGLSTLEVQTGGEKETSHMGYKPVTVTPAGTAAPQTAAGSDMSQTMLTVGKYLTPQLYISYGRSLFTGSNLFRLRYDISRHWQIETQAGPESGADLFYKIEFN